MATSPYKYSGNVAPVKNVPKKATPVSTPGWNADSIKKAMGAGLSQGSLGMPGTATLAPAVTTAPPAGGGVSTPGHWNIPDYDTLLAGDWEPENAAIQGKQKGDDAEAAFQLALRRAFVDYGGDVNKLDDKFRKYIDDPTIEAAKNNKFSTMAQNLAASTRSLNNQRAKLAARGMTRSGANTTLTRQALEAQEKADYGAGRAFTGAAEEGLQGLASTQQSIADMIREAQSKAAARIAQENPQTWEPGTGDDPYGYASEAAAPAAAVKPPAGTVLWNGTPMNATQLQAELARTGVSKATWIGKHPGAAHTLGWA